MTSKDWRTYQRHPISARYPDLKGQVWEDFLANLTKRKVRGRSITLYEGKVLDGWQLQRACVAKNIEPTYTTLREGEDPYEYVEEANEFRRHESPQTMQERRQVRLDRIAKSRAEGKSVRAIADQEGLSKSTIERDLKQSGVPGGTPDKITGQDGKQYPASTFCARCQRTGPIKDCKQCAELRAKSGRKQPAKRKKRSGSEIMNWRAFKADFTRMTIYIDAFGKATKTATSKYAEECRRALGLFMLNFRNWAKEATGEQPPDLYPGQSKRE